MSKITGQGLTDFATGKIGTPYVYAAKGKILTQAQIDQWSKQYPSVFTASYIAKAQKFIGKACTDCSGLISWYTGKVLGSAQLYSQAQKRIPIAQLASMPVGTILWKSGHVGVYIGNGYCIEAKGINYGTIKSKTSATAWKYGLLMSYVDYEDNAAVGTGKDTNPYSVPTRTLKKGHKGEDVKWLQWELREAGYNIAIDGDFGPKTNAALRAFQQSCKIVVDGLAGPVTRHNLIAD